MFCMEAARDELIDTQSRSPDASLKINSHKRVLHSYINFHWGLFKSVCSPHIHLLKASYGLRAGC